MNDLTIYGLIQAERERQIAKGYDAAHDDGHDCGELACAAAAYALWSASENLAPQDLITNVWPFDWDEFQPDIGEADLIKACALLIAEIERQRRVQKTAEIEAS